MSQVRRILCVDDEPTALTVRRLLLSHPGYTVLTTTSGNVALRLFSCNHVDLAITDHVSSDTRAELISEMKRLKPEVPIILLAALAEPPPGHVQADLLLSKGMMPQEFLAEVAKLLSNPQSAGQERAAHRVGAVKSLPRLCR